LREGEVERGHIANIYLLIYRLETAIYLFD